MEEQIIIYCESEVAILPPELSLDKSSQGFVKI